MLTSFFERQFDAGSNGFNEPPCAAWRNRAGTPAGLNQLTISLRMTLYSFSAFFTKLLKWLPNGFVCSHTQPRFGS